MKPKPQQHVLQRQHIEVAVICLSGCRLCAALASSAAPGNLAAAAELALVYGLSLLLEFGGAGQLGSPYRLRRSASHGIAEGVLAVPSVLAALAAAAPADGWQPWLQGSCSAAVAVLATILLQSLVRTAAHKHAFNSSTVAAHQSPRQHKPAALKSSSSRSSSSLPEARKPLSSAALSGGSIAAAAVLVCGLVLAGTQWQQQQQLWPASLWWSSAQQLWPASLAGLLLAPQGSLLQGVQQGVVLPRALLHAAVWAGIAVASFCTSLQLLPGCFSLGEAALLAQGATTLTITTAAALSSAALFVPAAICQQLPQTVLKGLQQVGGCSEEAHRAALSLDSLPAVISLVLAAAVAACLLLRVLHSCTQALRLQHLLPQGSKKAAGERFRVSTASRQGETRNGSSTHSNGKARSSQHRPPAVWTVLVAAAAALCSLAGIAVLLLWLCAAAAWTLFEFLPAEPGRIGVLVYWLGLLGASLPAFKWLARLGSLPQIIVRKVYHLLAMGLFVPVFVWDLQLLSLSLAVAFAVLVLLEVVRCMRLPVLGKAVQDYMQAFVDERDTGVIYITHFTLLLGLAVPVWLCLVMPGAQVLMHPHLVRLQDSNAAQAPPETGAPVPAAGAGAAAAAAGAAAAASGLWGVVTSCPGGSSGVSALCSWLPSSNSSSRAVRRLAGAASALLGRSRVGWSDAASALLQVTAGLSGLVIIGVGDTAASFVGKLFGRVPVHAGSNKTLEGTLAGIGASLVAWVLLLLPLALLPGLSTQRDAAWWLQLLAATAGAGLMEAATSQLDNILLPLWYLPHLLLYIP